MGIIRTFHPIGHGAFYTERHNFKDRTFTVVYDCGSKTLKDIELERKISSTFRKNESIDVLFISHFHEDHINGLDFLKNHCKIKRVVIPLIDEQAKALIKVSNFINGYSNTELIDNPQTYFGEDVSIISIETNPFENINDNGVNNENAEVFTNITGGRKRTFASGTVFVPFNDVEWFFIPFNYKYGDRRTLFEEALRSEELTLSDINTINDICHHKEKIIRAYKAVNGNLNETSMILFSGKRIDDYIHSSNYCRHFSFHQSGCLYMGDINLRQKMIVTNIRNRLKNYWQFIGTLQIPHHGSIYNFDSSILAQNMCCAIFSYGTNNTDGHPSDKVIGDVCANYTCPYLITEEQSSIVIQVS
ncbi:hypothetical protein EZS27_012371 [termite gut metagenome]|uniref:Metallo-beta-lactamase domain-containing protein n=1 Tax=termite gut metagenome TaxID=433724 RepID=A0A5J4S1Y7_9ZZZZ